MTQNPHDTPKSGMSKNRRKVALKSAKVSLNKGYFGRFKGYILCLGMLDFCFRGWKSPQGLYNRSKINPKFGLSLIRANRVSFRAVRWQKVTRISSLFTRMSENLENPSPIFRQHKMISLPRFGHFRARKMAAGKSAPPSGTLLDFLL